MYIYGNLYVGVHAVLDVDETDITENSATLTCELPCFSPNIQCVLSQFISCTDVNVTIDIGNIIGSVESYSYPTQAMIISGLNSGTTYYYCVVYYDATNMMKIGEPACGSFVTQKTISEANDDGEFSILYT